MSHDSYGFRFLEHMTDSEIEARGSSISEAFENAGRAVEDLMVDIDSIQPVETRNLKLSSKDLDSLLYDWIESLIALQDSEGMLFSRIECNVAKDPEGKYLLSAELEGEKFDPNKHEQKTAIKAPTYHDMKISEKSGQVTIRFLVDL